MHVQLLVRERSGEVRSGFPLSYPWAWRTSSLINSLVQNQPSPSGMNWVFDFFFQFKEKESKSVFALEHHGFMYMKDSLSLLLWVWAATTDWTPPLSALHTPAHLFCFSWSFYFIWKTLASNSLANPLNIVQCTKSFAM